MPPWNSRPAPDSLPWLATRMLASGIHPEIVQERPEHRHHARSVLSVIPGYRILEIQEVSAATVDAATRAAIDRSAGGSGRKPVAAGHFLGASAEATVLVLQGLGRVAEWFKAAVLKTAVGATPPWVRIPPLPPNSVVKLLCLLK